ncbi:hypothetical protein [Tropicibacter sp. S64]|uniref:hypothetical protein n=1 Tax=Tropicibacter sp. S64 TaxID=3415122 RepID=UPI003C7CA033
MLSKFRICLVLIVGLTVCPMSALAQETSSGDGGYDGKRPAPLRGVAIIGQNFTAIPTVDTSVTFCCDGCGSSPDAPSGSGGVLCTGCTGGGGPVSCPSNTIRVTCADDMQGCPVE